MAKDAAGTLKDKTQQAAGKTAETLKAAAGMFGNTRQFTSYCIYLYISYIPELLSRATWLLPCFSRFRIVLIWHAFCVYAIDLSSLAMRKGCGRQTCGGSWLINLTR